MKDDREERRVPKVKLKAGSRGRRGEEREERGEGVPVARISFVPTLPADTHVTVLSCSLSWCVPSLSSMALLRLLSL